MARPRRQPTEQVQSPAFEKIDAGLSDALTIAEDAIPLQVEPGQVTACIQRQLHALEHLIRDPNAPPIDGGIGLIAGNIDALRRVHPMLLDKKD